MSATPIELPHEPQRILLIKPSAVGDVVHALPVLNLMRRRWPKAYIAWLVTPVCAGLIEGHPQLDEIILFDRKRLASAWKDGDASQGLRDLTHKLRAANFDLVVDLQGLLRSGWMAWKTGAPVRVGFANAREMAPIFYTHRVEVGPPEQHAIERYLTVAEALGCGREPVEFVFPTDANDRAYIDTLIPTGTPYAVLLPGTNWETKRWPVESFAQLVTPIRERFGLATVVAGGPDAKPMAPLIGGIDVTGKTTLRQLVALLERADLVIANDSGPMHIAAALGRPLVTMFGPTNPVRTGPFRRMDSVARIGIPCSPCYLRECSHISCLKWLSVEYVMRVAERQLATAKDQPGGLVAGASVAGG